MRFVVVVVVFSIVLSSRTDPKSGKTAVVMKRCAFITYHCKQNELQLPTQIYKLIEVRRARWGGLMIAAIYEALHRAAQAAF